MCITRYVFVILFAVILKEHQEQKLYNPLNPYVSFIHFTHFTCHLLFLTIKAYGTTNSRTDVLNRATAATRDCSRVGSPHLPLATATLLSPAGSTARHPAVAVPHEIKIHSGPAARHFVLRRRPSRRQGLLPVQFSSLMINPHTHAN
jgi:hypothetical protein